MCPHSGERPTFNARFHVQANSLWVTCQQASVYGLQCRLGTFWLQSGAALAIDRTVRLLTSLNRASTSRVLNLAMIAAANANNPEHGAHPLFVSPAINRSILLKHRVRADDSYVLGDGRAVATKIIIPFDPADLKAGGRSFFVGQKGFRDMLREIGQYSREAGMERDVEVLRLINRVPSLDPFLLREQLRGRSIK